MFHQMFPNTPYTIQPPARIILMHTEPPTITLFSWNSTPTDPPAAVKWFQQREGAWEVAHKKLRQIDPSPRLLAMNQVSRYGC